MLFIYAYDIVYLSRLQKSLKFAILVGKKSKICDFLEISTDKSIIVFMSVCNMCIDDNVSGTT